MTKQEFEENTKEMNLKKMHFLIGENSTEAKNFGIYQDSESGEWVCYKNKADGTHVEHYRGDEAAAFQMMWDKIQSENNIRKAKKEANAKAVKALDVLADNAVETAKAEMRTEQGSHYEGNGYKMKNQERVHKEHHVMESIKNAFRSLGEKFANSSFSITRFLLVAVLVIIIGTFFVFGCITCVRTSKYFRGNNSNHRHGYYTVGNEVYYQTNNDWFWYNNGVWVPYYNYDDSWYNDYYGDDYDFADPEYSWYNSDYNTGSDYVPEWDYDTNDKNSWYSDANDYDTDDWFYDNGTSVSDDNLDDDGTSVSDDNLDDDGSYQYDYGNNDTTDWYSSDWDSYDTTTNYGSWDSDYDSYDSYDSWDYNDSDWGSDW